MPTVSLAGSYLSVGGSAEKPERQKPRNAMKDDRYEQIFEDLKSDLLAVAKRHGKRALREAVRDAAKGELLQEDNLSPEEAEYPEEGVLVIPVSSDAEEETAEKEQTTEEESAGDDIPPEELEYPDESVWTLPPPPDEREDEEEESDDEERSEDEEHQLSDAAERVLDRLMDKLEKRAGK